MKRKTRGVAIIKITAEGYEDTHAQLILDDFRANPKADWIVELLNEDPPAKVPVKKFSGAWRGVKREK